MPRYGCYELRTSCDHCGNPVPINGPTRKIRCTYCLETISVGPEAFKSLLEDLVDEYGGLAEREGRSGTIMSGRTYKYGYWRLPPRCPDDNRPLPLETAPEDGEVACSCGKRYPVFPAPDWLKEHLPAERIVCAEREQPDGSAAAWASPASMEPIVMACPACGGGLKVTRDWDRVHPCQFCSSQVFIPDALWKRLHPIKKVAEWFVVYSDQPKPQLPAEDDDLRSGADGEIFIDERDPFAAIAVAEPAAVEPYRGGASQALMIAAGVSALLAILGVLLLALG